MVLFFLDKTNLSLVTILEFRQPCPLDKGQFFLTRFLGDVCCRQHNPGLPAGAFLHLRG